MFFNSWFSSGILAGIAESLNPPLKFMHEFQVGIQGFCYASQYPRGKPRIIKHNFLFVFRFLLIYSLIMKGSLPPKFQLIPRNFLPGMHEFQGGIQGFCLACMPESHPEIHACQAENFVELIETLVEESLSL